MVPNGAEHAAQILGKVGLQCDVVFQDESVLAARIAVYLVQCELVGHGNRMLYASHGGLGIDHASAVDPLEGGVGFPCLGEPFPAVVYAPEDAGIDPRGPELCDEAPHRLCRRRGVAVYDICFD